jgi:PAS domain S-box-containing protein
MEDPAQKKGRAQPSRQPRVSAVKSIVTPRRRAGSGPTLPQITEALYRARVESETLAADEKILRAHVHALERLFPEVRFAMRLVPSGAPSAPIVQATTHYVRKDATDEISVTEAGLLRAGFPQPTTMPHGMTLRRTYRPVLRALGEDEAAPADGLDAPLSTGKAIVGVVAAEVDRGADLPPRLEDALVMCAMQAGASIESARLRRETMHLRDYLEKLLEHANIPVLVIGRDRSIRVASRAFVRITGLEREQIDRRDLLRLASSRDRTHVLSAFVSALRGREVPTFELRLPKAGGGHARLEFALAPILDSEGRVAGVIAIGQDRTEVRELEGQVIHAEKLATLGQLAAGIVHEINNPLTSISVYGEYLLGKLRRSGAEESDVKRVERILRSSDRIMSFTRNLLTYARPSKEEARPVDVNDVLEEAVGFCEHVIREAKVQVSRHYAKPLPEVRAVPGQLHQVFVNLITNACNAAHERGGEVALTTRLVNRDRVQIEVQDDGVGIRDDDLRRVFEPFFSTRRGGKGTGLGLSIVKRILEEHAGAIEIESQPGRGTRVLVTLPSSEPQPD